MKVRKDFVVRIGGNEYTDTPNLLACKGEPLLRVAREEDSGDLDVELDLFDEKGKRRATVHNGEVVRGSGKAYDVRMTENSFTVFDRRKERTVCEIRRRANARDMDIDVSLLLHTPEGFLVHANPDQTNLRIRHSEQVIAGRDAALNIK